MSFWERVGEISDAIGAQARMGPTSSIAWQTAKAWTDGDKATTSRTAKVASLTALTRHVADPTLVDSSSIAGVAGTVANAPVIKPVLEALNVPISNVGRGLVTLDRVSQRDSSIFYGGTWAKAWREAEDISPGQAANTAFGQTFGDEENGELYSRPDFDILDPAQRKAAFTDDVSGRMTSGMADLVFQITLDPLNLVAGGAGKVARAARTVDKSEIGAITRTSPAARAAAESDDAAARLEDQPVQVDGDGVSVVEPDADLGNQATFPGSEGTDLGRATDEVATREPGPNQDTDLEVAPEEVIPEDSLSFRGRRQQRVLDNFISWSDDKSISELAGSKMFNQGTDAGALAYWFGRANEIADESSRHLFKRDIMAASFGDGAALTRLKDTKPVLVQEIKDMTGEITDMEDARALYKASSADEVDGQSSLFEDVWDVENDPAKLARFESYRDAVEEHLSQVNRIGATSPSMTQISGGKRRWDRQTASITAVINDSPVLGPVNVISGKRLPNSMNVADEDAVNLFREQLQRSRKYLDPGLARQYLDDFTMGDMDMTRPQVARAADEAIALGVAKSVLGPGADMDMVRQLLAKISDTRVRKLSHLKARAYSAAQSDEKFILHREDGQVSAIETPLLAPQITGKDVSFTDPKLLAESLRMARGDFSGFVKWRKGAWEWTDQGLMTFMRNWKLGSLFRVAYPIRNQADTQLRMAATLRTQYLLLAAEGTKNFAKNIKGRNFGTLNPDKATMLTTPDYYGVGKGPGDGVTQLTDGGIRSGSPDGINIAPARDMSELAEILRKNAEGKQSDDWLDRNVNGRSDDEIAETLAREQEKELRGFRGTGDFVPNIVRNQAGWAQAVVRVINKQFRNDPVAQRIINGESTEDILTWMNQAPEGRKHWKLFRDRTDQTPDMLVNSVRGYVDSLLPPESALRAQTASGTINERNVIDQWPIGQDAPNVHGEMIVRDDGLKGWFQRTSDFVDTRIAEPYYKWVSDAPEQKMGRSPFYATKFKESMRQSIDNETPLGANNTFTAEQVERFRKQADRYGRAEFKKVLYDASRQSNAAHMARHVSPFFSAWQDSMGKWGKMIGTDPVVGYNIYKLGKSPHQMGLVTDEEGRQINANGDIIGEDGTVVGKAGWLDGTLTIPLPGDGRETGYENLKINKNALNLLFQGDPFWLPGTGPLVAIPVNTFFVKVFPEAYDPEGFLSKYLAPVGTTRAAELGGVSYAPAIPTWMRRAFEVMNEDSEGFTSTFSQMYAETTQQNRMQNLGMTDSEVLEKAKERTRTSMLIRAVASNASPVATQRGSTLDFYKQEYQRLRREDPQNATSNFFAEYPEAYEVGISVSENEGGIAATDAAYRQQRKYSTDIQLNSDMGTYYVGAANVSTDDNYNPAVRDAQFSDGTRTTLNPVDAMADIQASKGWDEYRQFSTQVQLLLEERGLTSLQSRGAEDIKAVKDQFVAELMQENPAWARKFGQRDADKVGSFLRDAGAAREKHPELRDRPEDQLLDEYMGMRAEIQAVLATREVKSLDHPANADVMEVWETYTNELVQEDVGFEQIYYRYLQGDDLAKPIDW